MEQPIVYPQVTDVLDGIRSWMRKHQISQAKMARMADVHSNVLNGMYDENWSPSLGTIKALEKVIREDLERK